MRLIPRAALAGLMLCGGCTSETLAPDDYAGEPLAVLELFDREGLLLGDEQIAIGLHWLVDRELPVEIERLVPHPDRARGPIDAPLFNLTLYSPPPDAALLDYGTGAPVAIGLAVAWRDADGDRIRDTDEPAYLTTAYNAIIYSPEALDADASPTGRPMSAGYGFVNLPLPCGPLPPTTPGDCGVPLGALCEADTDCGPGACIELGSGVLSSQRCVVLEPPADGCRPGDGILDYYGVPQEGVEGRYLPYCTADADCPGDQICAPGGQYCGGPVPYLSDRLTPLRICLADPLPPPPPPRPPRP